MTPAQDAEAVRVITRQLQANPGADPEWLATAIWAALRGFGCRVTELRPAADWRMQRGTSPGGLSDEAREKLRADAAAANERRAAEVRARALANREHPGGAR